jgi:pimeloyl-ACP methyl ester carboxylesterase
MNSRLPTMIDRVPAGTDYGVQLIEPSEPEGPLLMLLRPSLKFEPMPLAVCVHGYTRQPLDQLRAFAPLAARLGFALALPLFDDRHHRRYQQLLHPRRGTRSDLALLAALDAAAGRHGIDTQRLFLFGYSGGAQFVHRFAMCHPQRTAALAIGAAGWYTWPDEAQAWPLGLADAHDKLGAAIELDPFLRLPMALWVGERDTAADEYLRDGPQLASLQGAHRLDRARHWAASVRAAAKARGIDNRLEVTVLPRAGHDFGSCDRRGDLAAKVMGFFDQHR